jgi:hypothetical protein
MRKTASAADPDAYVLALTGWRRACVETLRTAVRKGGGAPRRGAGKKKLKNNPMQRQKNSPRQQKTVSKRRSNGAI